MTSPLSEIEERKDMTVTREVGENSLPERIKDAVKWMAYFETSRERVPAMVQLQEWRDLILELSALRASPQERQGQGGDEFGWLVENGKSAPDTRYRMMDELGIQWTDDPNKALRFARRVDAEGFAAGDEDAWRIVEHAWHAPAPQSAARGEREANGIECHGLDTPDRVRFYEHDFYVLSNFSAFRVRWMGEEFDTSEHAYHWMRFPAGSLHRDSVKNAKSAHEAFRFAQSFKHMQLENWDAVKVGVMRDILRAKAAQHEYVRRKLLATGERLLVEDSWRDPFWGWGPNRDGQNMLGKLWMDVRAELLAAPSPGSLPEAGEKR